MTLREGSRVFANMKKRRLEKLHLKLLEEARDLQRKGDIQAFASKTAEAAEIEKQLEGLAGAAKKA
ncbi:MAG: DUF6435 family protein [Planctomycetota bacterium]